MKDQPNLNKKIEINSESKEKEIINKSQEKNNRYRRRLLPNLIKINKSSSNIKANNKNIKLDEINLKPENDKSQSNIVLTDNIDVIKKIKEAKEMKDLEKIFKKWNQEKKIFKIKEKEEKKQNDIIKIEINQKKKKDKKKKSLERREKERRSMIEKIKELRKKKENNNELEDLKKIEKNMKKELELIIKKSYLFYNKLICAEENETFTDQLEYIIDVSNYIQKEIKLNKDENLIEPDEAVNYEDNLIINILGYFGSELSLNKLNVLIEKEPTNELLRDITFKIIASDLAMQKVYKIFLENEDYIISFNEDAQKWFIFLEDVKRRISNIFSIPNESIYFFGHNLFRFEAYLLIYNKKINNLEKILQNFNLKAEPSFLLNNIILSPCLFESEFCKNENEWPKNNLVRGGKRYYPPYGWLGISLRVKEKYSGEDENWIGDENKEGEWPVAYHGINNGNIFYKVLNIINGNLKEGPGQFYKDYLNVEKNREKYFLCGKGVYLSPNIKEAEKYSENISLGFYNLKFKFAIMARINPTKIRSPGGFNSNVSWIVNGNDEEIRPYRLLIKIS